MKAALFQGPGQALEIGEVPDPTPGPGELVLRVSGCGICGSDLHMSQQPLPAGMVMGHEFAGEVVAVGRSAEGSGSWKVGDRVCSLPLFGCGSCLECLSGRTIHCAQNRGTGLGPVPGAYAEYVLASGRETFALPENLESHEGALIEPLAVGLHAIEGADIRPGDDVLIVGAGPVGIATALWARHFGAREVVASDFVAHRREMIQNFGATAVIDPGSEDVGSTFEKIAGRPPAVVIECVGVPGVLQDCIGLAPARSRIVVAGVCMVPDTIVPVSALMKELTLRFVAFYERKDFAYTLDMLRTGRIAPQAMITETIGLSELPDAFEQLRKPSTQCKVVVRP